MKALKSYSKCPTEDLDPFNGCSPVNCELKYFGKRNFFNLSNCVPAAICDDDSAYDFKTNTCERLREILSENDIKEMNAGRFTNWVELPDEEDENSTSIYQVKSRNRIKRRENNFILLPGHEIADACEKELKPSAS